MSDALEKALDAERKRRAEVLSKPPPIPCKGYWTHTTNGSDFDCEYDPPFVCEDCIVNGGRRDPREPGEDEG